MLENKRGLSTAVLTCAVILSLSACGSSATQSGAEEGAEELEVFYSAARPNLSDIQLYVAQDEGIFEKYGLDVSITETEGVSPTFQSVVAGRADVGYVDMGQVYAAANQGQEMKVIADTSPRALYFLITSPEIQSWDDLADARVGVSQPGTLSERIVELAMEEQGVKTDKVQHLAVGGSSERLQAVASDRVDAGVGFALHAIEAEKEGLQAYSNLAEVLPDLQGYTWASNQKTVEERRGAMVSFAAAIIEATRLVMDDKQLAIETYLKYQPSVSEETADKEYAMIRDVAWAEDGGMESGPFEYTTKTLLDAGEIQEVPSFDSIMATDIRDDALTLIEENE